MKRVVHVCVCVCVFVSKRESDKQIEHLTFKVKLEFTFSRKCSYSSQKQLDEKTEPLSGRNFFQTHFDQLIQEVKKNLEFFWMAGYVWSHTWMFVIV